MKAGVSVLSNIIGKIYMQILGIYIYSKYILQVWIKVLVTSKGENQVLSQTGPLSPSTR